MHTHVAAPLHSCNRLACIPSHHLLGNARTYPAFPCLSYGYGLHGIGIEIGYAKRLACLYASKGTHGQRVALPLAFP
ncbi:hypothetical protein UFOVP306_9 [uncultured Caudovirales phage]|uniref:Uncharacterized protein n=1 Tax=uncultured Caudovirales phage TaxID=2100421 RepID=A0A6J5LQJ1_9CAUD|nr:hypothetical protein UFOVP306_9 [uncultured Caudovirales phage]